MAIDSRHSTGRGAGASARLAGARAATSGSRAAVKARAVTAERDKVVQALESGVPAKRALEEARVRRFADKMHRAERRAKHREQSEIE